MVGEATSSGSPSHLFTPIFYKTLYLANLKSKNIGGLKLYATPPKLNV